MNIHNSIAYVYGHISCAPSWAIGLTEARASTGVTYGRVIQNFSETAMNTRLLLRHGVGIVAGCFLAGLTVFSAPVYASQTFTSNIGPNGEHASATFTTGL